MSTHPTPEDVWQHPERIPGYSYGTSSATPSPLTLDDLMKLKAAVGLTDSDDAVLRPAGEVLTPRAAEMVDAWRSQVGQHPFLARYSAHPDGSPNPEYAAASTLRFDRWVIDACTRPLDQAWLDQQHEIGLCHNRAKKNQTDHADSVDHIPLRYLLAFTAVIIVTARNFLADERSSPEHVDEMHAAFTKSVMLHVTVWTRAYTSSTQW
ncbi:protoglobin domain-containing protein [Mycolicibacterium hodleri]|uniref:Protogloblin ApPgb n=1 Tax=Mycolicibacterium hodleri TaxID=49897 RepID=A0A502EHS5_9MYCO|nr:protoglobin domain-containing protein [Mycolicibacterium hodleri]TPG36694.1 protogloblin ApPgb [Mycolicibacterium hodleri]